MFVCALVSLLLLLGYQSKAAANKIFGNMTYFADCPSITEKVTLIDGERVVWSFRLHVSLYYEGHYVYGDFNHDGLGDAAVIIGESQGGSDDSIWLAFLIHEGIQWVHKQSVFLGDSAIIKSLKERKGKVVVDMLVHQEGDCMAGPTKRVKMTYNYLKPNPDFVSKKWTEDQ